MSKITPSKFLINVSANQGKQLWDGISVRSFPWEYQRVFNLKQENAEFPYNCLLLVCFVSNQPKVAQVDYNHFFPSYKQRPFLDHSVWKINVQNVILTNLIGVKWTIFYPIWDYKLNIFVFCFYLTRPKRQVWNILHQMHLVITASTKIYQKKCAVINNIGSTELIPDKTKAKSLMWYCDEKDVK